MCRQSITLAARSTMSPGRTVNRSGGHDLPHRLKALPPGIGILPELGQGPGVHRLALGLVVHHGRGQGPKPQVGPGLVTHGGQGVQAPARPGAPCPHAGLDDTQIVLHVALVDSRGLQALAGPGARAPGR